MNTSEKIELIINILEQCKADYNWYMDKFKDAEREENNIRHEMEGIGTDDGKPPSHKRRSVLATKWQKTLMQRRVAKDGMSVNEPINTLAESHECKSFINKLTQVLGQTRKSEKEKQNRVYTKRDIDTAPNNPVLEKSLNAMIAEFKNKGICRK